MSLFSKLFGGSAPKEQQAEVYKDFRIFAEPQSESGGYRIAARIEKDFGEDTKVHQMIRADTYSSQDTAEEASISKAKQFIDQVGDRVFD